MAVASPSYRGVGILGFAFTLIFTAFQSSSFVQAAALKNLGYGEDGFYSLAILYAVMAVCIFFAPAIIDMIGPRVSIVAGSLMYCLFMASFIHLESSVFLAASALNGFGAALLWTSQGTLLSAYTTPDTHGRLSGVFWGMLQCSLLLGSLCLFLFVPSGDNISEHTVTSLYTAFTVICCCGMLVLVVLPAPSAAFSAGAPSRPSGVSPSFIGADTDGTALLPSAADHASATAAATADGMEEAGHPHTYAAGHSGGGGTSGSAPPAAGDGRLARLWFFLRATFGLAFTSRYLQLVLVTTFYSGLVLTYMQGKYGEIVSGKDDDLHLPSSFEPRLVSWQLLITGLADIMGGVVFGRLADRVGMMPVLVGGCTVTHGLALLFSYINFMSGWITPNIGFAFVGSALLGFGDASVNTMVYAALCKRFQSEAMAARAFAVNFFTKSAGAGIAFAYSGSFSLGLQLGILGVTLVLATLSFAFVTRPLHQNAHPKV